MKETLKALLTSKKALATLVAILVWVVARVGWDVKAEELLPVVSALAAFVVGQGLADVGKEKAKIEKVE